jgi:hypothetical protein
VARRSAAHDGLGLNVNVAATFLAAIGAIRRFPTERRLVG